MTDNQFNNRSTNKSHCDPDAGSPEETRAGDDELDSLSGRRRLIGLLGFSAVAGAGLLPDTWRRPVVESVVLPAHAQTSPNGGGGRLSMWTYDNTGATGADPIPVGSFSSGSGPCGSISGLIQDFGAGEGIVVTMPCAEFGAGVSSQGEGGGPYQITSWIVDGSEIISGGGPVFSGSSNDPPGTCVDMLANLAEAMASADPDGGWQQRDDGILPGDGGCENHVISGVTNREYGEMTIVENNSRGAQWVLSPTRR